MSPTPVIIAAHNEEQRIGKCLSSLQHAEIEPIVVANGCDDNTVAEAESFGVQVFELPKPGKLPAIQHALRLIGPRAFGPILFTDADSFPRFPRAWVQIMADSVTGHEGPQCASGPLGYFNGNPASNLIRTVKRGVDVRIARNQGTTHMWGNNMAARFDEASLEAVLGLPHVWPGEDTLIEMKILEKGGSSQQITRPQATIMTSSRYMISLTERRKLGKQATRKRVVQDYRKRAAPGSITLGEYLRHRETENAGVLSESTQLL